MRYVVGGTRSVSGIRARRAPAGGMAALAVVESLVGLGWPGATPDRAARRSPGRFEPLRGTTDYGSHPGETCSHLGARATWVQGKGRLRAQYLLPKGLAYPATEATRRKTLTRRSASRSSARQKGAAETEATRIAEATSASRWKVG